MHEIPDLVVFRLYQILWMNDDEGEVFLAPYCSTLRHVQ